MVSGHLGLLRDPPLCYLSSFISMREGQAAERAIHFSNICISKTTLVYVSCCTFVWHRDSLFQLWLHSAVGKTWSVHAHAAEVLVALFVSIFLLPQAHLSAQPGQRIWPRCSGSQTRCFENSPA